MKPVDIRVRNPLWLSIVQVRHHTSIETRNHVWSGLQFWQHGFDSVRPEVFDQVEEDMI